MTSASYNARLKERYRLYIVGEDSLPHGPIYCNKGLATVQRDNLNRQAIDNELHVRFVVRRVA